MFVKPMAALATALLLVACASEPQQAVVAPPAPPPAAPNNFMVFFDWDRSDISQQARGTIQQAAQAHRSSGNPAISVTGHADKSGPNNYNMALSLRRANAVKDGLVREGVSNQAIQVAGRGEEQPLVQTADGVREPQNRRVEIAMAGRMVSTTTMFQGSDLEYCRHLSFLYRRYVSTSSADSIAGTALAKCEAGNYAEGIPVLQRLLVDAKFEFPMHTNWAVRPHPRAT
jgi:hypothetical protein